MIWNKIQFLPVHFMARRKVDFHLLLSSQMDPRTRMTLKAIQRKALYHQIPCKQYKISPVETSFIEKNFVLSEFNESDMRIMMMTI
jgi:hypothetical protein